MRIAHPCRSRSLSLSSFFLFVLSSPTISLKTLSHSFLRTLFPVFMAGASENFSADSSSADGEFVDDSVKFGFRRSEMYKENLAGTVNSYGRHVFLCYKTHESWPSNVENSESDPLPKLLSKGLEARKDDIAVKTRLTICEGCDESNLVEGDVLIFPEMIKYRGLKALDVEGFVEDVLVNGKPWASGVQEELAGSHVFVCAHNNRDRRCGICGPALIEKFREEIQARGLMDQVFVAACSHVGGHKYAGNVIIFSAAPDETVAGHWYGYVTTNDVSELLDQHIGKGLVIEHLWRGQMGGHTEEADKVVEQKIPNGNDVNASENKSEEIGRETENVTGCCQGAKGFSCCQEKVFEEKKGNKGLQSLSSWFGKLEQREVVTAVAVVGAVATIAVAYSSYRRSR